MVNALKFQHCALRRLRGIGDEVLFMETMDIFSLFGNILDNAIECESL